MAGGVTSCCRLLQSQTEVADCCNLLPSDAFRCRQSFGHFNVLKVPPPAPCNRGANFVSAQRKTKTDLIHLRSLPAAEPATSTGLVAWVWPEIQAGLATGKKLREIWEAAQLDGLHIPYPQFRVYVSRLRMREKARELARTARQPPPAPVLNAPQEASRDPFNNLREQRQKGQQSGFDYNPFSNQKDLVG